MGILKKSLILFFSICWAIFAQPRVCAIAVFDNDHIAEWKIKKLIRTRESPWYHKIIGKKELFKSRQLEKDLKIIENYYRSAGYLDVAVNANAHFGEDNDCIYINIFIDEGKQYFLGRLELAGIIPSYIQNDETLDIANSKIGEHVDPQMLQSDLFRIKQHIREMGYPYVTVKLDMNKSSEDSVEVIYEVDFGEYAYFGTTQITGINLTKPYVVERELKIVFSRPYNIEYVTKTRESLYGTGLFSAVAIEPENFNEQPETLDYNITLVEKPPRWTTFSIGTGSDAEYDFITEFAAVWGHRNLFGSGREFSIELISDWKLDTEKENFSEIIKHWSNLNNRIEFKYTEPYIFNRKIPVTLNPYYEPANSVKIPQYTIQLIGVSISGEYKPSQNKSHTVYTIFEIADIYDINDPEAQEIIFQNEGQYFTRSIGYNLVNDKRDNLLVPTEGSYFIGQSEMAGYFLGGDKHYNKLVLDFRKYLSFRDRYILAMRAKSSVLGNWRNNEYVLIHDRFFMGGANSVRGWKERSIGPISQNGDPLGGKLAMLGNIECRMPLVWHLWGHVFLDAGNVWSHAEAFTITDFKTSIGWGIAIITPVGPVRFDYGYQVFNKEEKPPNSNWHLALMYLF
ncbi:BamA/TamA family outer membrane protein [bacterium]|nr:BamA/TamA family outer membrane protein [bacterium]